ncbi:MAG: exo-alpha-sialidase [Sedimentisphaerales bacterium]|nr:exo-alpha-sialidase [Sedimentisphaerales bacterium]
MLSIAAPSFRTCFLTMLSICLSALGQGHTVGETVGYGGDSRNGLLERQCTAIVRPAVRIQFPGIVHGAADSKENGDVDCSSPVHWDGNTMYMFYSTGHPFRSSGPDLFSLSRPSKRISFDNEADWKMGGRWIESTYKAENGKLYMWYHNEPPLSPDRTAPRIGTMVSGDNGLTWRDLGIVLEAPTGSNNLGSANKYFVGGNGDFAVIADRRNEYLYFFISTYHKDITEQGVSVARMLLRDLDEPKNKVFKWHQNRWAEPGIGGHVTPIFPASVDWHRPDVDAFWGPSIHWNTYLNTWVVLLNRAKDKDWSQEGIYISFNSDLSKPEGWTKPAKILDASELEKSKWYPQVVGTDITKRETDKLAGQIARLFVAGVSKWEITFKWLTTISMNGEPQQTDLFVSGQDGYKAYRIPALVVSNKGTIMAICEARKNSFSDKGDIDLAIKRSFDNGRTWTEMKIVWDDGENTAGNPCPVVDRQTGTIWLPFCQNNERVFITKSVDDGASWSAPQEITESVSKPGWTWYATGPGHGIQLKSGRLLIPCDHKINNATKANPEWYFSHVIYSDDHGKNWSLGGTLAEKTNECQAVEIEDGSVYLNIRSYEDKNQRAYARSSDGGLAWSEVKLEESMVAPKCQASIARFTDKNRHGKNRVLFSSPAGTERENMTIRLSYDECRTWPVSRTLHPGPTAYSELAIAPDMTICCFYERGVKDKYEKITFARFNLEWLTQGKDGLEAKSE